MQIFTTLIKTLVFFLEIAMYIFIGYWGYKNGQNIFIKYSLALALPLLAMIVWGILAAPRSQYRLPNTFRILFSIIMFELAALMLYKTGRPYLAISFGAIALLTEMTAYFLEL